MLEKMFAELLSNERKKLVETCDYRLSLFERKVEVLLESKGTCNCIAVKDFEVRFEKIRKEIWSLRLGQKELLKELKLLRLNCQNLPPAKTLQFLNFTEENEVDTPIKPEVAEDNQEIFFEETDVDGERIGRNIFEAPFLSTCIDESHVAVVSSNPEMTLSVDTPVIVAKNEQLLTHILPPFPYSDIVDDKNVGAVTQCYASVDIMQSSSSVCPSNSCNISKDCAPCTSSSHFTRSNKRKNNKEKSPGSLKCFPSTSADSLRCLPIPSTSATTPLWNKDKMSKNVKDCNDFIMQSKGLRKKSGIVSEARSSQDVCECPKCGRFFANRIECRKHLTAKHPDRFVVKQYKCDFCSYSCHTKSFFDSHMRIHTKEKPFGCKVCSKFFSHKHNLKRHMLTHTKEYPFHCNECGKKFNQSNNLKSHIRRVHDKFMSYVCKICGHRCELIGNLKKHMLVHSGV